MIILKIALEISAAIIILVEQSRTKDKPGRNLLIIAFLCVFGTAIISGTEHYINKKSEIERVGDLALIQKMNSSLHDLAFEFEIVEVDSIYKGEILFQMLTMVNTRLSNTGMFANYLQIGHSSDSGWFMKHSDFERYKYIKLNFDEGQNRVRFVLHNFGVSVAGGKRDGWKPINIADMSNLNLELYVSMLKRIDYPRYYDTEWCPIKKISVYVNTFEPINLITVAERIPKTEEGKLLAFHYFLPKSDKDFNNPDSRGFYIDPLRLREAIINSME